MDITLGSLKKWVENYIGVRHCVAVSSCSAGLYLLGGHLPARTIEMPAFTFAATSYAAYTKTYVRTADINKETWTMDYDEDSNVEWRILVDCYGSPVDHDQFSNTDYIVDSAQSFGSWYKGSPNGNWGLAQVFSLSPSKIASGGEGGLIVTNNSYLADQLRLGRNYGLDGSSNNVVTWGTNARMPEISAVIARASLRKVDEHVRERNELARVYKECLSTNIRTQRIVDGCTSTYKDFTIAPKVEWPRPLVQARLAKAGITTKTYFSPLISAPMDKGYHKVSEFMSRYCLQIPLYNGLSEEDVKLICVAVNREV